jgi:hypothetical protein
LIAIGISGNLGQNGSILVAYAPASTGTAATAIICAKNFRREITGG